MIAQFLILSLSFVCLVMAWFLNKDTKELSDTLAETSKQIQKDLGLGVLFKEADDE